VRLQQFQAVKAQQDLRSAQTKMLQTDKDNHTSRVLAEQNKQEQVAQLLKEYDTLYHKGKYKEAETKALLAHDIDPDNAMVSVALQLSKVSQNKERSNKYKTERNDMVASALDEAEKEGPAVTPSNPVRYDLDRWKTAANRKGATTVRVGLRKNDKEREIERQL